MISAVCSQISIRVCRHALDIQWNLSNTDTLGPIKCGLIREVSSFQGANSIIINMKLDLVKCSD